MPHRLVLTLYMVGSIACVPLDAPRSERIRVMIETDAGGDPDDEQSLVRFLLYSNEFDVEGIICNRALARDGENLNSERTGIGIIRRQLNAYGQCLANLRLHDERFPDKDELWRRTIAATDDSDDGPNLVIAVVDSSDPRPLWFCNWGTDNGTFESSLKRALDRVRRERGQAGYERFKSRLRLSSADKFGEHTFDLAPPFPIWVDTFRPPVDGKRWYHRFSALTATAGGFDVQRDVLRDHGPLGQLYPTNTTHPQKEGDTMTFLYLVPTGMNDPEQPGIGSWAGRYELQESAMGRPYYWASTRDTWQGTTHRDQTLRRWAEHIQNDFRTRLDWCVKDRSHANHAPVVQLRGEARRRAAAGERVELDAVGSTDPDGDGLRFEWQVYPEAGSYDGPPVELRDAATIHASFIAPTVTREQTLHVVLIVTDDGQPPLTRYRRVVVTLAPK
jgi:hypothetical protein